MIATTGLEGRPFLSTYVTSDGELAAAKSPQLPLQPGDVVNGRYVVSALVGRGAIGLVYDARDKLSENARVALKFVPPRAFGESLDVHNEFLTMSMLRHPNVAAVHDIDCVQGSDGFVITMQFVPGSTLRKTLRDGWCSNLPKIVQVCRGLSYVHSRGIVHHDLKPENVLVSETDACLIADFGVARMRGRRGLSIGTPAYAAPETVTGGSIDGRADLYALGIMLFEASTGRLPCGGSVEEVLSWHQRGRIEWTADDAARTPLWLRRIVEKLCSKEPGARYENANEVTLDVNRSGGMRHDIETEATTRSYLAASELVGREAEITVLKGVLAGRLGARAVGEDEPHESMHIVRAPSGMGKSRLLREVRIWARVEGFGFVETNCYEGSYSEYGPIADAARAVAAKLDAQGKRQTIELYGPELAKISPQLAAEYGLVASMALFPSTTEQRRIIAMVAEFFVVASESTPFALCIDDLQWAQPATVHVLKRLSLVLRSRARKGDSTRLALLGSIRDDEIADRPIAELLFELTPLNLIRLHDLPPLDAVQTEVMVTAMLGVNGLARAFAERVTADTLGNPLYIEEVAYSLVENGSVHLCGGRWVTEDTITRLEIPTRVTRALDRRVACYGCC